MVNAISLRSLIWRGLGFLFVWSLLNVAAWYWGDDFARAIIPLYKTSFSLMTDHYELQTLRIESQREPYFKIAVKTTGSRVLNGTSVPNDVEITSQTLQGHAFQPVIIALSLLMVWPLRRIWHRALIVLMAVPSLVLVLALDIPFVFLGALEDLVLVNFYPDALKSSISVHAMHFLNGGGRLLLGLLAAMLSLLIGQGLIALFQKASHKNFIKRFRSLTRLSFS